MANKKPFANYSGDTKELQAGDQIASSDVGLDIHINVSAGATSNNLSAIVFSNSNGISFGLNGSTITGTVATNYQSQGAYLTTAMQSDAATISNIKISAGASSANLSALTFSNSNGMAFGLSASTITGSYTVPAVTNSSWTASDNATSMSIAQLAFTNSNGFTMSLNTTTGGKATLVGSVATNYQSQGAYLTTAALSSQTLAFSLSGNTATTNSSQILNGGYALAGGNGVTLQQSNNTISISVATNYQSQAAYLTTADLSANSSKYIQNWKLTGNTAGTTSSAQGTDLWFAGGNGLTISGSSNTISFSVNTNYQSQGAYLTTARASTDAIGLNTAKTNVTWTANSSGISLDAGGYAGTNTATTGGISVTLNTSGISLNIGAYLTTADLSANSSKYVQEWAITGNTAGTTSSAQGTRMYFSGGNSITISGSSNSLVFSVGNYITTAMASNRGSDFVQATAAFAGTNASGTIASNGISVSVAPPGAAVEANWVTLLGANVSSNSSASGSTVGWSGSNLTLAATNNSQIIISAPATSSVSATGIVSISVNGATISIGASQSAQTAGIYASSNTYLTSSGTIDARSMSFRGDKSITVGISSGEVLFSVGAYLTTAMLSNAATISNINVSAGAASNNLSAIVFSNSNGISFGLNGSTITASGDPLMSYYANINNLNGMVTGASAITQTSGASIFMQPFNLQQGISASFIRFIASYNDSAVGTAGTTSANTSYSVERYTTFGLGLYSQGTGANSRSLQQISSTSVGFTGRTKYTAGNTGSQYTVSIEKTFPQLGFSTNVYATSYAVSSGSIVISSNSNTLFTGAKFLDIPWLSSIPAGNYWLGIGASVSSNSNSSNISFAGTNAIPMSLAGVSQTNLSIGLLGAATSASDHQLFIGLGVWTTNASTFTRNSIGMDSISQVVSNPLLPFQIIRMA